jgi:hypothetical protein
MKLTSVNDKLRKSLRETIEVWIEDMSYHATDWPDCFVSQEIGYLMAQAAVSVLEAQVDLHNFLLTEGYLDDGSEEL